MHIFIDFWKLETENNLLHVFSFLHKLSFENSFCFLSILDCQTSFLVSKIENYFWKQKIRGKNSYRTYPKSFVIQLTFSAIFKIQTLPLTIKLFYFLFFFKYKNGGTLEIGTTQFKCSWSIIYVLILFLKYSIYSISGPKI